MVEGTSAQDAVSILAGGVEALADLGSEEAFEVLQEAAFTAAGSHARTTGVQRDPQLVALCQVLLDAHQRASAARRIEQRRQQLRSGVAEVVEAVVKDRDVHSVLAAAVEAMRRVLHCQGVSIRAFDLPGSPSTEMRYSACHPPVVDELIDDKMSAITSRAAEICWAQQTAYLMHLDDPDLAWLTSPEDRDFALDIMRASGSRELLLAPLGADGRCQGWIVVTRAALHDPFGPDDVEAVLAIGREIGNAVRHARAFRLQQELIAELRELSEHKSWFTATLAHQLRNPLTSIGLHLEDLIDEVAESDGSVDLARLSLGLAAVDRSAHVIESTVESLLALARLEGSARPTNPGRVDLHAVVLRCVEDLQHTADAAGVRLDTDGVAAGTEVIGETSELEMVVDNIVGNAVKYTPSGGVVRLTVDASADHVLFACHDEGIGMSDQDVDQLFTPFHRATEAQQRRIPGSGLGMAIVRAAVDRHDGTVKVASEPGHGTRIDVRLPAPRHGATLG